MGNGKTELPGEEMKGCSGVWGHLSADVTGGGEGAAEPTRKRAGRLRSRAAGQRD